MVRLLLAAEVFRILCPRLLRLCGLNKHSVSVFKPQRRGGSRATRLCKVSYHQKQVLNDARFG